MLRKAFYILLLNIFTLWGNCLYAQDIQITEAQAKKWLTEITESLKKESVSLEQQVNKRVQKIQQEEQKLQKAVQKAASKADSVHQNLSASLDNIVGKIPNLKENAALNNLNLPYSSRFDSLQSLLGFIKSKYGNLSNIEGCEQQMNQLKGQMAVLNNWEKQLTERKEAIQNWVMQQGDQIPLIKAFRGWQMEAEAFRMEIKQWKETVNNPEKIEQTALSLATKIPAFKEFMQQHGELGRLFGPVVGNSSGGNTAQPLPGLQTRANMQQDLMARFGQNALQAGGALQQQMQAGMQQMSDLQNQLTGELNKRLGGNTTELTPAQKEQAALKSKTLKERLELSWNIQSATRLQNFPAVRDVGVSLGYKINPRSVIGIGIAYKFALGENWKHIQFTHEGIGLRSFIDWRLTEAGGKLFKNIWLTGGFEINYWERIGNNAQWKELAWQKSGLVGLSKTVKFKKKEGKVQVLWDYLSNTYGEQKPIIFRISQNF